MRLRNFCYEAVKAINCVSVCSIACSTHFEMCYVYISERTHVRCVNSFIGTCAAVHSCVDRNPCKVSKPSAVLGLVKHCSRCVRMRSLTCCLKDLCWCWITSHGQRAHRRGHSNTSVLPWLKKKKAFEKLQDLSLQETNTSYDIHLSDIKWVALAACLAAQKTLKSQTLKNSGKKRVKK